MEACSDPGWGPPRAAKSHRAQPPARSPEFRLDRTRPLAAVRRQPASQRLRPVANRRRTSDKRHQADVHHGGWRRSGCRLWEVQRTSVLGLRWLHRDGLLSRAVMGSSRPQTAICAAEPVAALLSVGQPAPEQGCVDDEPEPRCAFHQSFTVAPPARSRRCAHQPPGNGLEADLDLRATADQVVSALLPPVHGMNTRRNPCGRSSAATASC